MEIKQKGGARPGAGRKSKADELGLAELFDRVWPTKDREKVIKRLSKIASGSDSKAAVSASSLLFAYAYGKPTERHEHANPDGSALLQPIADAMIRVYGSSATGK